MKSRIISVSTASYDGHAVPEMLSIIATCRATHADCAQTLQAMASTDLNLSMEMPVRLHRHAKARPVRASHVVAIAQLESWIKPTLAFVNRHIGQEAVRAQTHLRRTP